jgi:hypothetical protein
VPQEVTETQVLKKWQIFGSFSLCNRARGSKVLL